MKPRFRLTVRSLMVAVAASGLVAWGTAMKLRAARFREKAESFDACEQVVAAVARARSQALGLESRPTGPEAERVRRRAEWCVGMRSKYERAARHPWLPVGPDPPEPE